MEEPTDLTKAQRQRADALVIAARVLGKRPNLMGASGLPDERTPTDLVDLAQFILDGHHPLEGYDLDAIPGTLTHPVPLRRVEDVPLPPSTPGDNPGDNRNED